MFKKKSFEIKLRHGFTLLEIMVVITLLIILIIGTLSLFNPKAQIDKANDAKRKSDVSTFRKVSEDWYNDKDCYPRPEEICYDSQPGNLSCHICGSADGSPEIKPYLNRLICDPQFPRYKYLYQVDDGDCPGEYRMYTTLSNRADPDILIEGCAYNFGAASPNTNLGGCPAEPDLPSPTPTLPLPTRTPTPTLTPTPTITYFGNCSSYSSLYILIGGFCNICESYDNCQLTHPGETYYSDAGGGGDPGCMKPCYPD